MTLMEALQRTLAELATNGLHDWNVGSMRNTSVCGRCWHHKKLIELSEPFVNSAPDSEIVDTILHEIAHALVGPGHRHNVIWQSVARRLGARPERCGHVTIPARYKATCSQCGVVSYMARRPKITYACKACYLRTGVKHVWQYVDTKGAK